MLSDGPLVAVHETAHQWFYAMVGDSQARDPWLDEAFATYAEQQVNGDPDQGALKLPGKVGGTMQDFGNDMGGYFNTVYFKGAAALAAARTAAGPAKFDAALRCYVNANAWRIARPADLARALAALPVALAVLRRAGALP
jgi:aminopeptidase N